MNECNHNWVFAGGANPCSNDGCCDCSVSVYECSKCGDCDYGEGIDGLGVEKKAIIDECNLNYSLYLLTCEYK